MVAISAYAATEKLKKDIREWQELYDVDVLDYCLQRTIVICPSCSSAYAVKDLDEQLNTDWRCTTCGTRWEETPTHDIKKG